MVQLWWLSGYHAGKPLANSIRMGLQTAASSLLCARCVSHREMTHGSPPFFPSVTTDADTFLHSNETRTNIDMEVGPCKLCLGLPALVWGWFRRNRSALWV